MLVGGSGKVGGMVVPFLKERLAVRILDLRAPVDPDVEYVSGHLGSTETVGRALEEVDAVVYMAMPPVEVLQDLLLSHDVNVKGVHIVLEMAYAAGIRRAVYLSTGSVHAHRPHFPSEDVPCDAASVYGFTKALGESVCHWFCRTRRDMTVVALRLWNPVAVPEWEKAHATTPGPRPSRLCTLDRDVAESLRLSLSCEAVGFHPIFIAGDSDGTSINLSMAEKLLGWRPTPRPRTEYTEVI